MACRRYLYALSVTVSLSLAGAVAARAVEADDLAPYKMLRSLQFVQDSVALGDHSAAEMQRFMLGTIDKRLRSADPSVFEDQRNVDAALIYTMSGGNPSTLEYLASKDTGGYFDNRLTDALRKYLGGKGALISKTLTDMLPEYKDKKIGPYLALVSANTIVQGDPVASLKYYDWARLTAPGTIVEEAALRRSVAITSGAGMVDKGLVYSSQYARRFLHSPYASQFADLFVMLAVDNFGAVKDEDITQVLDFMDKDRRREVYLRIARKATIAGKTDLARMAAAHAGELSSEPVPGAAAMTSLYGGAADISGEGVSDARDSIQSIPDDQLSPRDQALRAAAAMVADEVLREPDAASLTQDDAGSAATAGHGSSVSDATDPAHSVQVANQLAQTPNANPSSDHSTPPVTLADAGPEFTNFVSAGRSKLGEIDDLLNKESSSK